MPDNGPNRAPVRRYAPCDDAACRLACLDWPSCDAGVAYVVRQPGDLDVLAQRLAEEVS